MKKGLRLLEIPGDFEVATLKPCPDEEGIKTRTVLPSPYTMYALKPCPDEEGIKTIPGCNVGLDVGFKTLP